MTRTHTAQRGAALIMTLVAIAIVGVLMAAVGNLVIGHYARAQTDQDAAKALNYAESALNVQIQKITVALFTTGNVPASAYGTSETSPYQVGTDSSVSTYFAPANVTNGVTCWVDVGSGGGINPYVQQYVYGKATVNGVTRYVRAKVGGDGIFDRWAVFGVNGVTGGGSLVVNGLVGSGNGPAATDLQLGGNSSALGVDLYGGAVYSGPSSIPQTSDPDGITLPTITAIANQAATGVQNYTATPAPAYKTSISNTQGILDFAGTTANDTTHNDNYTYGKFNGSAMAADGSNDPKNNTIQLVGKPWGANYYLTSLGGVGGTVTIQANILDPVTNTLQPINLWVNSTNTTEKLAGTSSIQIYRGSVPSTDQINDSRYFRIYYRNPTGTLQTVGGSTLSATIYAYDTVGSTVELSGNTTINGTLIANQVIKSTGSVVVNWPNPTGIQQGEGVLFYGVKNGWQEWQPVRGY